MTAKSDLALRGVSAMYVLRRFIGMNQKYVLRDAIYGKEAQYFVEKLECLAKLVESMPKTYEQEGKGDDAVVSLHYFYAGMDFFITERDKDNDQHQAYGWSDVGHGGELRYISIVDLIANNIELDLHFVPTTLGSIKAKRREA